jgi:hypothetical protein
MLRRYSFHTDDFEIEVDIRQKICRVTGRCYDAVDVPVPAPPVGGTGQQPGPSVPPAGGNPTAGKGGPVNPTPMPVPPVPYGRPSDYYSIDGGGLRPRHPEMKVVINGITLEHGLPPGPEYLWDTARGAWVLNPHWRPAV